MRSVFQTAWVIWFAGACLLGCNTAASNGGGQDLLGWGPLPDLLGWGPLPDLRPGGEGADGGGSGVDGGGGGPDLAAPDLAVAAVDLAVPADLAVAYTPPDEIYLVGGTFLMGTNSTDPLVGLISEKPAFSITVPAFYLDQREATVADYKVCMAAGKCAAPAYTEARCNVTDAAKLDHPMNCLNQIEAAAYCLYMKKRLPKEEELELAMRGTTAVEYAWGTSLPNGTQLCWMNTQSCPEGSYPKTLLGTTNPNGFVDLAGNISEWTSSPYNLYPARTAPVTASDAGKFVVKGGTWGSGVKELVRGAYRGPSLPTGANPGTGVRCARTG